MSLDVDTVKAHIRVTHTLEDELIGQYIEWAKSTITNAVFDVYSEDVDTGKLEQDTTYKMGCIMLVSYYYENRLTISEVNQYDNPYAVLHAIQTLRGMRHHFLVGDTDED